MAADKVPRILLVEDDVDLCDGWNEIFQFLRIECRTFHRAHQALAAEQEVRAADLLITDYYLPDLNGVELAKRLRAVNAALKVIMLTGSREQSVLSAVQQLPDCALLHKPVSIDDLEKKIFEVLG